MANILRITTDWTGFPGAPGFTNLYARHVSVSAQDTADDFANVIHEFWYTINGFLPADVTTRVNPTWQDVDEVTGNIVAEGSLTDPEDAVAGTNADTYAGNVGVAVNWLTGSFINGRRLKGRTYFVPMVGVFAADGTLADSPVAAILDAAVTLIADSPTMVVWHRPVGGTGGESHPVTGATISDRAAILRSRAL